MHRKSNLNPRSAMSGWTGRNPATTSRRVSQRQTSKMGAAPGPRDSFPRARPVPLSLLHYRPPSGRIRTLGELSRNLRSGSPCRFLAYLVYPHTGTPAGSRAALPDPHPFL